MPHEGVDEIEDVENEIDVLDFVMDDVEADGGVGGDRALYDNEMVSFGYLVSFISYLALHISIVKHLYGN